MTRSKLLQCCLQVSLSKTIRPGVNVFGNRRFIDSVLGQSLDSKRLTGAVNLDVSVDVVVKKHMLRCAG